MFKSIENSPDLQNYLFKNGINEHPLQKELREYTEKNLGNAATMQISPDQGALLQFIIKSSNIQNCLEIGTFTGYSALTMALALPENGSIVSLDIDKKNTDIAKKYWSKHSVSKKIDFILAPALETMEELCFFITEGNGEADGGNRLISLPFSSYTSAPPICEVILIQYPDIIN